MTRLALAIAALVALIMLGRLRSAGTAEAAPAPPEADDDWYQEPVPMAAWPHGGNIS